MSETLDISKAKDDEHSRKQALVDQAIDTLRGLFDAVIVVGTWTTEDGETATALAMDGNWHAQTGMMHYMLRKREEEAACEKRSEIRERYSDDE